MWFKTNIYFCQRFGLYDKACKFKKVLYKTLESGAKPFLKIAHFQK